MGVFPFESEATSVVAPARLFKALILDADNLIPKVVPQALKEQRNHFRKWRTWYHQEGSLGRRLFGGIDMHAATGLSTLQSGHTLLFVRLDGSFNKHKGFFSSDTKIFDNMRDPDDEDDEESSRRRKEV